MAQEYKEYRKIATVKAKLFEPGDETGLTTRFTGFYDDVKSENLPYISTLENNMHISQGFGKDYICIGIKGERWLVDKDIFEKTYVEVIHKNFK